MEDFSNNMERGSESATDRGPMFQNNVDPKSAEADTSNKTVQPARDSVLEDLQFEVHKEKNWASIILWITAAISVVIVGFLFYMNYSLENQIDAKVNERSEIVSDINSSEYSKVEQKAIAFKKAATELIKIDSNLVKIGDFVDEFYTKVYGVVQISNLAISADGSLSFDGTTKDYRSIADQSLVLKNWDKLSDVEIGSVSNDGEGKTDSYSFTISAKAQLTAKSNTSNEEEAL